MISKYQAVLSVVFITVLAGTGLVRAESHQKANSEAVPQGLILDLDADRGIKVVNGRVTSWKNQVDWKVKTFTATRDANHEKGTGHPKLKEKVAAIDGHNTVVFNPKKITPVELQVWKTQVRKKFYSISCIFICYSY